VISPRDKHQNNPESPTERQLRLLMVAICHSGNNIYYRKPVSAHLVIAVSGVVMFTIKPAAIIRIEAAAARLCRFN
jgi:hypothetical protein